MNEYLILAAGMILLPGIYICLTFWQTEKFNGMSKFEVIVLAAAEIAFLRMWRTDSAGEELQINLRKGEHHEKTYF